MGRHRPGDIVVFTLTGERVMVVEDLSIAAGHLKGCTSYDIRLEDKQILAAEHFELELCK